MTSDGWGGDHVLRLVELVGVMCGFMTTFEEDDDG